MRRAAATLAVMTAFLLAVAGPLAAATAEDDPYSPAIEQAAEAAVAKLGAKRARATFTSVRAVIGTTRAVQGLTIGIGGSLAPDGLNRQILSLAVWLASETSADQSKQREEVLDSLYSELQRAAREPILMAETFQVAPETRFKQLIATPGPSAADYLTAMRDSRARVKGAEGAGQREWMSKHLDAAKRYAALAANALEAEATLNDARAAELQKEPFAVRHSRQQAVLRLQQIKPEGLTSEQRKLLQEAGLTESQVTTFQAELLKIPDKYTQLGISIVEFYRFLAERRRALAASLLKYAGH